MSLLTLLLLAVVFISGNKTKEGCPISELNHCSSQARGNLCKQACFLREPETPGITPTLSVISVLGSCHYWLRTQTYYL